MPVISRFYGITLKMYFRQKEHNPPHIHAIYGEYVGLFSLLDGEMFEGNIPTKYQSLIKEFIIQYENMLDTAQFNLQNKLNYLRKLEFENSEIKNIILTNPLYLNKTEDELFNLIDTLKKYGVDDIKHLININPFILNLDGIDIDLFFKKRVNNELGNDDIVDLLEQNPFEINE